MSGRGVLMSGAKLGPRQRQLLEVMVTASTALAVRDAGERAGLAVDMRHDVMRSLELRGLVKRVDWEFHRGKPIWRWQAVMPLAAWELRP